LANETPSSKSLNHFTVFYKYRSFFFELKKVLITSIHSSFNMLLAAFITGLVGSLHCLGMCGPIAMALPRSGHTLIAVMPGRLLYNLGRVTTYSLLGGLAGLLGHSAKLAGFQQSLSIGLGIALLLLALFSINAEKRFFSIPAVERMMGRLRARLGKYFGNPAPGNFMAIGLLNGLLPCGFVYLALAGAAAQGHIVDSMTFMAFFGLGTIPMMMGISLLAIKMPQGMKSKVRPFLTAFAVAFALLLIVRGMRLDIPYISPATPSAEVAAGCG
jgi:sulfite exporter TauE/SafE